MVVTNIYKLNEFEIGQQKVIYIHYVYNHELNVFQIINEFLFITWINLNVEINKNYVFYLFQYHVIQINNYEFQSLINMHNMFD